MFRATRAARHFAIVTAPTAGHFNPLQALGAELVASGDRVTIVHIADAGRLVSDPAIGFAPLSAGRGTLDSYLATLARPSGPIGLRRMIRATAAMTQALLEGAPAVLEAIGVDAVIADAVEPAGGLVARRIGVPHVVAVTGLPLLAEESVPPPFVGWRYRDDAWGRSRNRGGYAVADRLMRPIAQMVAQYRATWRLGPDDAPRLHVAQCPRGLDFPRAELPPHFRYGSPWRADTAGDTALPIDARPLVFCSLGTLQGARRGLFGKMARACADLGARAVIAHGGGLTPADEAALPGDPLVRAFWPQQAVLRHCSAAILHGGFNSVLDALAAGVPIVALPIGFEQPATAARLARIGAGRILSPRSLGTGALRHALAEVMLRPGYREAARGIAREIAAGGGARAAAAAISEALAAA